MNKIGWIIFGVFSLVILEPLAIGNYLLIPPSSDMMAHTTVIHSFFENTPLPSLVYLGQAIVGYPFALFLKITHLPLGMTYIVFNFLVLVGAAFTMFFITSRLVNKKASWFVVPLAMFCSMGIIGLFKYGVIFNIINMYIILPWAIYLLVRWSVDKGIWRLIGFIALFLLFGVFHSTGWYLLPAMATLFVLNLIFHIIKVRMAFALCLVGILPLMLPIVNHRITSFVATASEVLPYGHIPFLQFVGEYLGFSTFILIIISLIYILIRKGKIYLSKTTKVYAVILGSFALALLVGMIINAPTAVRLAADLGTILALLVVIPIAQMYKRFNAFSFVTGMVAIAGTIGTLSIWLVP